jgi:lysyl-tRNA synthetase class 2
VTDESAPGDGDSWRPTTDAAALRARARLLAEIRQFFEDRLVLEVETPVLSSAGNSDPGIRQFRTADDRWLRTSPEYPMKRLLAAGAGDIYELGRVFRAGEAGSTHNPEFTMLEWYRVGWTFEALMDEVAALVDQCGAAFGRRWRARRTTWRDWIGEAAGLDPLDADAAEIATRLEASGLDTTGLDRPGGDGSPPLDRDGWLDLLVTHVVQPAQDPDTLTLVSLYPASQAALARLHPPDPRLAERFEAYLGSVELANGYQELTDPVEQRRRFEAENARRRAAGTPEAPLDEALLAALAAGLPDCAGVALGVDRLLMALTGAGDLPSVLPFPADRA